MKEGNGAAGTPIIEEDNGLAKKVVVVIVVVYVFDSWPNTLFFSCAFFHFSLTTLLVLLEVGLAHALPLQDRFGLLYGL